jgi:hypothetical protein
MSRTVVASNNYRSVIASGSYRSDIIDKPYRIYSLSFLGKKAFKVNTIKSFFAPHERTGAGFATMWKQIFSFQL